MMILGLTGGIGMGKSTTAKLFAEEGVPIWDADASVHKLYAPGGKAVEPVAARFPNVATPEGAIDRAALAAALMAEEGSFADLEAIVHPLVGEDRAQFIEEATRRGEEMVLLDIPLLLEGRGKDAVNFVIVCSAPEDIRRARVLERPGMTAEKYDSIVARQMPDAEKRKLADFIVPTGEGIDVARAAVRDILFTIREKTSSTSA